MPAIKIDSSTVSSEKLIDSESLSKLKSFSSISKILNIKAPEKSELRNLEDNFNTTRTNIKNTISNAETLMNYMSDIIADTITFTETVLINEFTSSTWVMKYNTPLKAAIFKGTVDGDRKNFLTEINKLSLEYAAMLEAIIKDVKETNDELCNIENTDTAFTNFIMQPRIDTLSETATNFVNLVELISSNETIFSDVEGTLNNALIEQKNNVNTSKTDETIAILESAIERVEKIAGVDTDKYYKAVFNEFYKVMQFIQDFIKHDRAMLYLFFMYRVGDDNDLFEKIFLKENYSGLNDLIQKVFDYGENKNQRPSTGDITPDQAKAIAESKSKILSRWPGQSDSDLSVNVDGLLKTKIKNTLNDINTLKKEHFDSVEEQKAAVIIIRTMLTNKGDFSLFNFGYMANDYGERSESIENDYTWVEGTATGGIIGLGAAAATAGAITIWAAAVGAGAGLGASWGAGMAIAVLATGPVGLTALGVTAAAAAIGAAFTIFTGETKDKLKQAKTMYTVKRRKIKVDEGGSGLRDPAIRFSLMKHTKAVSDLTKVFYGNDSAKTGDWYGVPNRNDLFAMTFHKPIVMYAKHKKLQLLKTRMKNYKSALQALRDIADTSETTSNFTTFREILGENGNNLIYCKNRLSDLNASSKYNFINNRQTLTNENEILGIDSLFSQTALLKENSNENLKILSFAINSSLLKKFDNNDLNIIKMTITKTDKININDSFDPVIILLDLAMFPTFKSEITSTPSTFSEYVKNNIEFKRYDDQYVEKTTNYIKTKQHMRTIGLTDTTADNMLALSVSSLILEKYLKYLVGFNFDYLDVIDNNISTDEGSEEIFNKILEENKLTESDETVSRLKKLLFEKSTLFNSKKIEYETLAQNEIVKTFHVMLNIKDDFPRQKKHMLDFDYNVNRALNSYEFEVTYEALPNETEFSSVALSTISLLDSLA